MSVKCRQIHLRSAGTEKAFSLLEILVVITIMIVLIAIGGSLFTNPKQDMSQVASSLSDTLQRARTHAMSNNTYVYVGLSGTDSASPQLALAVVESKSGLRSNNNDLDENDLQPVRQLSPLKGVQLDTTTANDNLPDNPLTTSPDLQVEAVDDSTIAPILFSSDVTTRRDDITDDQFDHVIQFSPDGAARLDATTRTVPDRIVLGLIPTNGDAANSVGIIIDGPSGAVRVLRP